ncbi:hypothetical protein HOF65_04900 [bacterium]|jgi:hypothetical protein|nr:hypothetical protein [bacterium]
MDYELKRKLNEVAEEYIERQVKEICDGVQDQIDTQVMSEISINELQDIYNKCKDELIKR